MCSDRLPYVADKFNNEVTAMIADNPLVGTVFKILKKYIQGVSEFQLVKILESVTPGFAELEGENAGVVMFRKHFMVMNALFVLQSRLMGKGVRLAITPLKIKLVKETYEDLNELPEDSPDAMLRDFYFDWENYDAGNTDQVKLLLNQFWERYLANDIRADALEILGLPVDSKWESVKQSYRRLAAIHHPDRGGDSQQFNAIREAYETLQQL